MSFLCSEFASAACAPGVSSSSCAGSQVTIVLQHIHPLVDSSVTIALKSVSAPAVTPLPLLPALRVLCCNMLQLHTFMAIAMHGEGMLHLNLVRMLGVTQANCLCTVKDEHGMLLM